MIFLSLQRSLRRSRHSVGCLILTPALLLSGCKAKQDKPAEAAQQRNAAEVSITPALAENLKFGTPQMTDVHGTLQVAARVETNARQIAHVGSPVAGRILKLLVFEGQYVKPGTVLATLHSTNLSDTQFALIKASSQQSLAAAAEKRAEQLVDADVIGRAELERRRAEVLQATTEAESYRTQLLGLGMTETQIKRLEATRKLNADYPIVTPKAGTVLRRDITIGQVVQPADPAFTIADLSSVWITANVPEEDAGHLHDGMNVEVRIPALPLRNHHRSSLVCLAHRRSRDTHRRSASGCAESARRAEARRARQHDLHRPHGAEAYCAFRRGRPRGQQRLRLRTASARRSMCCVRSPWAKKTTTAAWLSAVCARTNRSLPTEPFT